jgi:hypothetical protein
VSELLLDEPRLTQMGQAARQVVQENQGALQLSLDQIARFLPAQGSSPEERAGGFLFTLSGSGS